METSSLNQIIETDVLLLTACVVLFFIWKQLNSKLQFHLLFQEGGKQLNHLSFHVQIKEYYLVMITHHYLH